MLGMRNARTDSAAPLGRRSPGFAGGAMYDAGVSPAFGPDSPVTATPREPTERRLVADA